MTQEELAGSDLSTVTIQKMERGGKFDQSTIKTVADRLEIPSSAITITGAPPVMLEFSLRFALPYPQGRQNLGKAINALEQAIGALREIQLIDEEEGSVIARVMIDERDSLVLLVLFETLQLDPTLRAIEGWIYWPNVSTEYLAVETVRSYLRNPPSTIQRWLSAFLLFRRHSNGFQFARFLIDRQMVRCPIPNEPYHLFKGVGTRIGGWVLRFERNESDQVVGTILDPPPDTLGREADMFRRNSSLDG